ncbi:MULTISPECIES: hypothetical protein [Rhizobium]|uniref:Pam3-gp28 family putative phage holin n=1 Tax=Rhizobium TaxID=379 RepID=UPI00041407DB|nr:MULTISPECIES: hypothetical protein [Rhizobium]UFS81574.1 hypothetical protein LPB79_25210 [Rhizobium sp. T136]
MNPRVLDLIRTFLTIAATIFLADSKLSPEDINTIAGAGALVLTLGYGVYEKKHEGWRFGRRRFEPGEEIKDGGQTWICKE